MQYLFIGLRLVFATIGTPAFISQLQRLQLRGPFAS
jgi:hypothetical protein